MICAWIVISDLPNKSPAEFASVRASAAAAKFLCWSVQLKSNHSKNYGDFWEKYISFSGISVYIQQKFPVA